jgi:DNA invertase Pin-like site-specific DNA recombinase
MRTVYPLLGDRRRQQIDTAVACYVQKSRGGQNKKITSAQAAEIRERRDRGESAQLIADDYGVTKWNVYAIAQGRSWQTQS